jgi:hypothetical protein
MRRLQASRRSIIMIACVTYGIGPDQEWCGAEKLQRE